MAFRCNAENHGQHVFRARQVPEGNAYFITCVESKIEAQNGFDGGNGAWQVFAELLRFQSGGIRIENPHQTARTGTLHHQLGFQPGPEQQTEAEYTTTPANDHDASPFHRHELST